MMHLFYLLHYDFWTNDMFILILKTVFQLEEFVFSSLRYSAADHNDYFLENEQWKKQPLCSKYKSRV